MYEVPEEKLYGNRSLLAICAILWEVRKEAYGICYEFSDFPK